MAKLQIEKVRDEHEFLLKNQESKVNRHLEEIWERENARSYPSDFNSIPFSLHLDAPIPIII